MLFIYKLIHSGETIPEDDWDHEFFKILGYFSSREKALQELIMEKAALSPTIMKKIKKTKKMNLG